MYYVILTVLFFLCPFHPTFTATLSSISYFHPFCHPRESCCTHINYLINTPDPKYPHLKAWIHTPVSLLLCYQYTCLFFFFFFFQIFINVHSYIFLVLFYHAWFFILFSHPLSQSLVSVPTTPYPT